MSTDTTSTVGDDHLLHDTIMLSAKHIVASIEASNASIETLLCRLVESQAQNQQQMMEMLKILANNAGTLNEGNAGNNPIGDDIDEVVENGSSEINEQQQDGDNQVNEENNEYNYDGYEPLIQAINIRDWKKANEYLHDNQTLIKDILKTRDSRKEVFFILRTLGRMDQYTLLGEFLKLVPPETLESHTGSGEITILHHAALQGDIKFVKALVEKNSRLTQIRASFGSNDFVMQFVPLVAAVIYESDGQKEVVEYLCSVTRDEDPSPFSGEDGFRLLLFLMIADMDGVALSVCKRFARLLKDIMNQEEGLGHILALLLLIAERPFSFLSGSKMKWWERYIYSLIRVDVDTPRDGGIALDKHNVSESFKGSIKEDEENPPVISKVFSSSEQFPATSNNKSVTRCISVCFRHYIRRVPIVRRIYDQKLRHENVVALTKCFLSELGSKGLDNETVIALFLASQMLESAMKFGCMEFVLECLREFPFLCLGDAEGEVGYILMKSVISERNEMIYNFTRMLKKIRSMDIGRSLPDKDQNTKLHYCAELPHNRRLNVVSGAAFQMQREIQWFKMVENTMRQKDRFVRNNDGDTAHFLFTEKHKGLMKEGETWMKDLSTSCMVVAALIATVAFAAAITVPGGNIQDNTSDGNGLPVLLNKKSFMVFATADALALFSSITSVLMFLAVFTSRYSEEDFLKSLPQKLIIGLATLFLSMASILVSFGAAFVIILEQRFHWTSIAVSLFSCVPVLLFGFLQFPLFFEMVSSTYSPTILRKPDYRIFLPYVREADKFWVFKMIEEQK